MKNITKDPGARLLPEDNGKRCILSAYDNPLSLGIVLYSNDSSSTFYLGQNCYDGSVFISPLNPFRYTYAVGRGTLTDLHTNNIKTLVVLEPEEEASLYSQPLPTKLLESQDLVVDNTGAKWVIVSAYFPIYVLTSVSNPEISTGIVTAAWLKNRGFSHLFEIK